MTAGEVGRMRVSAERYSSARPAGSVYRVSTMRHLIQAEARAVLAISEFFTYWQRLWSGGILRRFSATLELHTILDDAARSASRSLIEPASDRER